MTVSSVTHLNFRGDARAALEFYQSVFGGELALMTYTDAHSVQDPSEADLLSWGGLTADNGFSIMAYDVQVAKPFERGERSFFVSVRGDDAEEITRLWTALSEGASVEAPMGPAAWSPAYGMLTDRFGITWVLDVAVDYAG